MEIDRQEAYRHLLYTVLLHLRAGQRDMVWWNPVSWWRMASELRRHKALADHFHNLALFSVWNFEQFDETLFWQDINHFAQLNGREWYDRYRGIFDDYLTGHAARTG